MSDEVFTPEEVENLALYQACNFVHAFTCPNHGDGHHKIDALVPTVRGWICQFCDYTQEWAHDGMKDGSWARAANAVFDRLPR